MIKKSKQRVILFVSGFMFLVVILGVGAHYLMRIQRDSTPPGPVTLHFSKDREIGTILIRNWRPSEFSGNQGDPWKNFAPARGDVTVPAGQEICLDHSRSKTVDLAILTKAGLAQAGQKALTVLDLSYSGTRDSDLVHLKDLKSLRRLLLVQTPITGGGLAHLERLPSLESLDLQDTKIGDIGVSHIKKMKSLKHIYLPHDGISKEVREELKQACPALRIDGE